MNRPVRNRQALLYLTGAITPFLLLQGVVVVMHEFTHSTVAWLLGYLESPAEIVWGNPILLTGWDEGVPYSRLFPAAGCAAEAIIGGSPLAVHAVMVVLGLLWLHQAGMEKRKWLLQILFWFVIANFMELIDYIVMRPFASGGDTGHFNRGLELSPWVLFIAGTLTIAAGLFVLFRKTLPLMDAAFARQNRLSEQANLTLTAFVLFLWGSGLRVVFYVYPDPQWLFGLIGFAAFGAALLLGRPKRAGSR